METDNIDILLDSDGEDKIEGGDFAIGDGVQDDCSIILQLNAGELKSDPMLGPTLIRMMNSHTSPTQMKQQIKLHLNRDNKYPKDIKFNNGTIDIEM